MAAKKRSKARTAKRAVPLALIAIVGVEGIREWQPPHIEIVQGQAEPTLLTEVVLSTRSGAAPTLGDWVKRYPGWKDFI